MTIEVNTARDFRRMIRRATVVTFRAKMMRGNIASYYDGVVHNCARVSRANNTLAFAVHKVGVFGGPVIQQITRPDVVQLSEVDDCVIVKDGYVYELKKDER